MGVQANFGGDGVGRCPPSPAILVIVAIGAKLCIRTSEAPALPELVAVSRKEEILGSSRLPNDFTLAASTL